MTGLWLEYLFWDEKAIQMLSQRMPTRHKATRGPWNGCTWGNPYRKLDWQGGLGAFPSTRASEKLKGNHNALGMRSGNCLNMRVSNCSGIKRIRTWNANIAGIKGEKIWRRTHIIKRWRQSLEPYSGAGFGERSCALWRATHFHSSFSQLTSAQRT